ncbi:MAG: aminotransferase class IV [Caldilineales bacterium]|nr:aminotransferase class IV [Caldilineales bacterium]
MSIYPLILHNGQLLPQADCHIPITTPALVGALGVYETILARRGKIIALNEHLARLQASASGAQLHLAADLATLCRWCRQVLAASAPDGLVRVLAMDLGRPEADVYIYQMSYTAPAAADYETGVPVVVYHGERALPLVKSFNTLVPGLARKAAVAAGAHDALLVDRDGYVTEGSNCNVFVVQAGVLLAPPLGVVLEGTVMERVIRLAAELAIPCQRRPLPLAQLPRWDEAFLTSTRRGVLPINRVGDHVLGGIGPVTARLWAAYQAWEELQLVSD